MRGRKSGEEGDWGFIWRVSVCFSIVSVCKDTWADCCLVQEVKDKQEDPWISKFRKSVEFPGLSVSIRCSNFVLVVRRVLSYIMLI